MVAHCYDASLRNFKAFTFSPLAIFPYELEQQTQQFRLLGNQIRVHVSFYLDRSFEYDLISGFRVQPLTLGKFGDKLPASRSSAGKCWKRRRLAKP